jgi:uncharacterized membrane protein HdeD (DUF308 family)
MAGVLAIIAGFVTVQSPVSSGLAFTWVLGIWGILSGSLQVAMSLAARSAVRPTERVIRS